MKQFAYFLVGLMMLSGCRSTTEEKSPSTVMVDSLQKAALEKIDVHAHYQYSREYFPEFFKKWNMRAVLVDVAKADSTGVNRSWDAYVENAKSHPELFWLCSSLIGVGIDDPDFAKNNIERLQREIDTGARMVKVWKNFGMVTKDASGKFIQIDDPRLQPIWDFLEGEGIPVMAHIGEPRQAWRPLDDPNNPHYGYYTEHPEYHAYKLPDIPAYETIIAARDRWIVNNPDLKVLCAHFGSMSHDVGMIAERLDKFPNMYVESAARFGDLAGQDSEKVKAFFEKYQDRILFGTDFGNDTPQTGMTANDLEQEKNELDASYQKLWEYLSGADSVVIRGQHNTGLKLPDSVLKKVYYQNAVDFFEL
jgi:predicted TIM-barrel fold metal-dependent hydrolase